MSHYIGQLFEMFFFPPGIFILFLGLTVLLEKSLQRLKILILIQMGLIYILSIPFTSDYFFSILETIPPLSEEQIRTNKVDAIVVLAGGMRPYEKEYHGPDLNYFSQLRLRYAAWLQKKTNLDIIVTGGVAEEGVTEAELMKQVLQNEYEIKGTIRVEKQSKNTYENALYSSKILAQHQYQNYYLVTSAFHMPRALEVFKKYNNNVLPAPMGFFHNPGILEWGKFKPHSHVIWKNYLALHEIIGRYWYHFYYG